MSRAYREAVYRDVRKGRGNKKKEIALILFDLSVSFIFVQLSRQERMLQE